MADVQVQSTSLLDDYLTKASVTPAQVPPHQLAAPADADALPDASQASFLAGKIVLQSVHQALDEVLASAGEQQTTSVLPRPYNSIACQQQQPGAAAKPSAVGSSPTKDSSKHGVKGIFRAMRQADAAAIYAERFKRDQEQQGQLQETVLMAPADGSMGTVRTIANNAALQAKLQRLQSDMDARSYRQELLQQLQYPGALFQQQQHQAVQQQNQHLQRSKQQHMCSNSLDLHQTDTICSARTQSYGGVFQALGQDGEVLRPATSPALMGSVGGTGFRDPAPTYSCAATAGNSRRSSSSSMEVVGRTTLLQHASASAAAAARQQQNTYGRSMVAGQQQQQQYKHVQRLVQYQLPWNPPRSSSAAGKAADSSSRNCRTGNVYSSRPADAARQHLSWSGSCMNSSNALLRRRSSLGLIRPRQSALGSAAVQVAAQQKPQTQPSTQRPASAVAALEQSLSEIALLKSKYSGQQLQQQTQQQPLLPQQGCCSTPQQQQQQHQVCHHTWLVEPSLQHFHETIEAGIGSYAAGVAAAGYQCSSIGPAAYGTLYTRAPSIGGFPPAASYEMQANRNSTPGRPRRQSVSPGYHLWDTWQQQVHSQPQQAAAAHRTGYSSTFTSQACRSRSAPRQQRVWDVLPLPTTAAVGSSVRSRRHSSTGRLSGHLQHLWQQQEQQQLRPRTAAAALESYVQAAQSQTGNSLRPLGPHNQLGTATGTGTAAAGTRGSARKPSVAGTAAAGIVSCQFGTRSSGGGNSGTAAWLLSSPLKRTQQLAATNAVGSRLHSISRGGRGPAKGGAEGASSTGGAAGRARAVAAALSGMHSTGVSAAAIREAVGITTASVDKLGVTHVGSAAAAPGRAAAVATQLLQQMKSELGVQHDGGSNISSGSGKVLCSPTKVYADRLATAASGMRGGSSAGAGGAIAPLTAQILEYAAGRYSTQQAKHRASSSGSSSSSDSSQRAAPAASVPSSTQTAYVAALARVRAASRAAQDARRRGDSSSDEEDWRVMRSCMGS